MTKQTIQEWASKRLSLSIEEQIGQLMHDYVNGSGMHGIKDCPAYANGNWSDGKWKEKVEEVKYLLSIHDSSLAHNPQWLAENGLVRKEDMKDYLRINSPEMNLLISANMPDVAEIERQAREDLIKQIDDYPYVLVFDDEWEEFKAKLSSSAGNVGHEKDAAKGPAVSPSPPAPEAKDDNIDSGTFWGKKSKHEALPSEGNKWTPALLAEACEKLMEDKDGYEVAIKYTRGPVMFFGELRDKLRERAKGE